MSNSANVVQSKNDRRKKARHLAREAVLLEIMPSFEQLSSNPEIVNGSSVDISSSGIQLELERELIVGTILDLCVKLNSVPRKFFLTAEVRWCSPVREGLFNVGIEIINGMDTDYNSWMMLFED